MNGCKTSQTNFPKMKSFPARNEEEQGSRVLYLVAVSEMLVACGTLGSSHSIEVYAFPLCYPAVPWLLW